MSSGYEVLEKNVIRNNKSSSKVSLPKYLEGKKVLIIVKNKNG